MVGNALGGFRMTKSIDGTGIPSVGSAPESGWLHTLRRYIIFVAGAHLLWEFAHLPFYTIWDTGTPSELVFAAVHCTGGDILISVSSVMLALFVVGDVTWPSGAHRRVVLLTVLIGVAYTIFSEWLNIVIREAWAYRDIMPVVPIVDAGLTPVLQWIAIPIAGFWWATRETRQDRKFTRRTG